MSNCVILPFPIDSLITSFIYRFYSHSECNLVCRLNNMISLCNCYTYISNIQMNNVSICYLDDLPCLIEWKESWFNLEPLLLTLNKMKVSFNCPDCMPTCDYIKYKIQTSWGHLDNNRLQNRSYWPDFVMNVSAGNHTIAHIYYGSRSVYKNRQTIVDTWYDLLSECNLLNQPTRDFHSITKFQAILVASVDS